MKKANLAGWLTGWMGFLSNRKCLCYFAFFRFCHIFIIIILLNSCTIHLPQSILHRLASLHNNFFLNKQRKIIKPPFFFNTFSKTKSNSLEMRLPPLGSLVLRDSKRKGKNNPSTGQLPVSGRSIGIQDLSICRTLRSCFRSSLHRYISSSKLLNRSWLYFLCINGVQKEDNCTSVSDSNISRTGLKGVLGYYTRMGYVSGVCIQEIFYSYLFVDRRAVICNTWCCQRRSIEQSRLTFPTI